MTTVLRLRAGLQAVGAGTVSDLAQVLRTDVAVAVQAADPALVGQQARR